MFQLKRGEIPPRCLNPNVSCSLAQGVGTSRRQKVQVGAMPRPHDAPSGTGGVPGGRGLCPWCHRAPTPGQAQLGEGVSKRGNLRALIGTGDPVSLVRSLGSGFKSRLCILLAV